MCFGTLVYDSSFDDSSRGGEALQLSVSHLARSDSEKQRVELLGSNVVNDRLMGLMIARSFGDLAIAPYGLIADPHVVEISVTGEDEFIILATDGVSVLRILS